jgi:uncharacterized protein (DUF362 family)
MKQHKNPVANFFRDRSGVIAHHRGLTRRDFIRDAALSAGLGLALGQREASSQEARASKSKVVLVRDENALDDSHQVNEETVTAMLKRAMQLVTGEDDSKKAWGRFVKPTDIVGIKANVMITPTKPELLRAIIRELQGIGVPGENIYTWDRVSYGVGLEGADPEKRTGRCTFDSRGFSTLATERCTVLLNVPGTKVHSLCGVGIAVKNWVGGITFKELPISGNRNAAYFRLHEDSCADLAKVCWIPEIREKCKLNIVEAFRPLFHGGPQVDPKYLWDYKGLFVSEDPVAVDVVCAKMLQAKRDQYRREPWPIEPPVKHLMIADSKYHLGTSDLSRIDLIKDGYQEGLLL